MLHFVPDLEFLLPLTDGGERVKGGVGVFQEIIRFSYRKRFFYGIYFLIIKRGFMLDYAEKFYFVYNKRVQ